MLVFDESRLPLVIARLEGEVTIEEVEELERSIDAMLDRHQPYAIVWDLLDTEIPPPPVVMAALRWTKRIRLRARNEYELAVEPIPSYAAYVMSSRVVKVLRFFEQMSPRSDAPTGIFATTEDGIAAAEDALVRFGCPAPPRRAAG